MFSGSAVVDEHNTAGFQKGAEKTLICVYTAAGATSPESQGQPFTQCIAYSNDRGKTWTKYSGNPVLHHMAGRNRDPKVVWHAATRKWIMALFLDGNTFRFLSSPDLKTWNTLHDIVVPGCAECPDFFEMAVEGEPGVTKWVWTAANDRYLVGDFDGRRFIPEVMTSDGSSGESYYAVQTYSGLPDGRRVQLGWMKGGQYPGMPFNHQMAFPYELKLRRIGRALKLCSTPVREIEAIQYEPKTWSGLNLKPGDNPLADLSGDLWDLQTEFDPATAAEVGFEVSGRKISLKASGPKTRRLESGASSVAMAGKDKIVSVRMLVDRSSMEVFAKDGEIVMPSCFIPREDGGRLKMFAEGGNAHVASLRAYKLKSIWRDANA
jgi:sucrose-6-phosphate hydrolase SacC (GH32 family)